MYSSLAQKYTYIVYTIKYVYQEIIFMTSPINDKTRRNGYSAIVQ